MNALVILIGFAVGSIPFGVIIAKRRGIDITKAGSGNIGATNVGRVLGVSTGLVVLALDAMKGMFAVALATKLSGVDPVIALAGFAAILGHCFSPFLHGKGGKGVATALGVFALLSPALVFVAVAVWLLIAGRTKVPALGSLAAVGAATAYAVVTGQPTDIVFLVAATSALIVYTHRMNLAKLVGVTIHG
jgi:glycerol-3-phosphate acyltransferase PlsY